MIRLVSQLFSACANRCLNTCKLYIRYLRHTDIVSVLQGMKQTIQYLQDQLNLLTMETQQDYTDLRSASRALKKPLQSLQENVSR